MKGWAAAVMALSLTAAVGRAAELGLAFDAHLGPGTGEGEARAELIIGALDLYASAAVGEAPSVTVGGAYQTASASLRLEIELFPEGFVGTAGAGWEIVPDLGIEVEIEGGSGGLVGAALLFWYGVPVGDAGGSEVRGLFEFDGEGSL
ncbi:MAG: hypothetical protein GXO72_05740, partial [Caldiserica bacterium]|nr:hypothetical protein [Caldisericota bacterium]